MKTKINEKPLVDMTPAELQETFDEIGKPGNRAMLEDARNHKDQARTSRAFPRTLTPAPKRWQRVRRWRGHPVC
jgi:hypothetical protein